MRYLLALILFVAGGVASVSASSERVGDFALLDHKGTFHQLSYYGDHAYLVLAAHVTGDAEAASAARLVQAAVEANAQVAGFLVNAVDGRAALSAQADLGVPVLVDEAQLATRALGLTRAGETVVLRAETLEVIYRGPAQALTTVLAGSTAAQARASAGTPLPLRPLPQAVSYSADVVPILERNCVSCHYDGGIGSWPMNSHAMVRGWSPMMREVLMTRRMPPGQVDPHVGKPLLEVAGLTADEQRTLVSWIDAGAPMDKDVDPLAALEIEHTQFSLGEPDLVFRVAPQEIPATGVLDYRYVPVQLDLEQDVWVRAMEFVPGDRQVLHHVIAYVSSPADRTVRGRETGAAQGDSVGGFAPGRAPDQFRDDSGRLLRKGSNLLLQMHYTTSGRATVDETLVGLYLHDAPPKYVMSGGVAGQRRFLVPPHAKEYKLQGEQLVERDAYLYGMAPHMHARGKYMRYTAHYPDGTSDVLLSVPKYDFNWQFSYDLAEPLFLPAGTRIVADGAMDNSARNPGNPNPDLPVHFGLQTKHEMFFGFTTLRYVGDTPENIAGGSPADNGAAGR